MERRPALSALGSGFTTALLVTVLLIELLDFEFSAIVALPVGLATGVVLGTLIAARYTVVSSPVRYGLDAAAGFGYAVAFMLALRYVDLAGLRSVITVQRLLAAALAVAVVVLLLSWRLDRGSPI